MLIDAEAFEQSFVAWAVSQAEFDSDEVIAIDGKTVRRSFDRKRGQTPLHVVSAWAAGQSLALAQRAVDDESNEVTAIPDVLSALQFEGALVTIDAIGCQKDIAEQIGDQGGDYLLTLKANHRKAYEAVQAHFDERCFGRGASERGMTERTMAGLRAARARGRVGGRPRAMTEDDIAVAQKLIQDPDVPVARICEMLGISSATLYRYVSPGGERRM